MKLGIIGGSGLDNPNLLEDYKEIEVDTPFGKPSSPIIKGKIKGVDIFIISRHGQKHQFPPTFVNNKANIFALKDMGCKAIISTTAVGSLREEITREDLVIPNQFIDFTKQRSLTYFDRFEFGPIHVSMAEPFSERLRKKLTEACEELNLKHHKKSTVITIEGNRFSTRAESNMFRLFGADIINMSIAPEAILAREADVEYATIAMSTDYDSWKADEKPVTWEEVSNVFSENVEKVKKVLLKVIDSFSDDAEKEFIKNRIRTIPDFPKQGVMFRDLTTIFKDREAMTKVMDFFYKRYKDEAINVIAGIESRGFILGGMLAERLDCAFVPIRKKGKLPAEKLSEEYSLEYGTDSVEIHKDAIKKGERVLLVDDLIATGGTALASCNLIEKLGGEVFECAFIVNLPDLKGREKLSRYPVYNIVDFSGE
ncbi:MAG TPA: S-methyl-5'-thioadenosine phosphorylase [Patescibacteria group bacterium]|nr:S-methyl-5'-thioadenosine phosphorylase [Patescibacteria group bacterium]